MPETPINKIICGDALTELKKLESESVDCVITDPPYNIKLNECYYSNHKRKHYSEYIDKPVDYQSIMTEVIRVLKNNSHFYLFSGYTEIHKWIAEGVRGLVLKGILCWDKKWTGWIAGAYGYKYKPQLELICFFSKGKRKLNNPEISDVLTDKRPRGINHPCSKPLGILRTLIEQSTNKGDLVLDIFGGSGSTAVACKETKRNYLLIELNPQYVEKANNRIFNTMETFF